MTVRFRLLGAVEATVDDQPLALGYAQLRCMLAVLLVEANRAVTVDQFVDRVWAEGRLPREPRRAVQHNIWSLRRSLEPAPDVTLVGSRAGYRLAVDADTIDLHGFHALVGRAEAAAHDQDDERAADLLEQALSLWSGEPFADLDIDNAWLHNQRSALTACHRAARLELTDIRLRQGRHGGLLAELAADTAQHPLDERLAGQYLLALYRSGCQAHALEHYHRLQRLLAEELGADPSPPLQRLHHQILTADPTLAGRWQPGSDPGAAAAMFGMRADIPSLTGRDAELGALLDAGRDERGRAPAISIYTVDGMPGVGKTAFTVHVAHRLAHRFPDGNIFLNLRGHTPGHRPLTPGAALESLLRAVGVDPRMIPPELEDKARLWRDRLVGKKVLLVLDDAADHEQVRPLLPGTADNLVLITSRHRLAALDGVTSLPLGVLSPEHATELLVRLGGRVPRPGGDDEAAVTRIVASCGFLPLAITLAGAQLRSHPGWSLAYLADLLEVEQERLECLDVGDRSVAAAFDMSFRHRPTAEQRLFRLLGAHPGPEIDAYATAALTNDSLCGARRGLESLRVDHLVEETTPGRYRMHDLLRTYARRLAADIDAADRHAAIDRVLAYYHHTVENANAHLPTYRTCPAPQGADGPAHTPRLDDRSTARRWLAAELATLVACVHQAGGENGHGPRLVRLIAALHPFLRLAGYPEQALRLHRAAHAAAVADGDAAGQALALANLGDVCHLRGDYPAANAHLARAMDLFTELGDRLGQANSLISIGDVHYLWGDYAAATTSFARALDLATAIGDRLGQANAIKGLASVRCRQQDYDGAAHGLASALALYRELGDQLGQARALTDHGRIRYQQGDFPTATDDLTRALELYAEAGDRRGQAGALTGLGRVWYQRGELTTAARSLADALELYTAVGDRRGQANALIGLGAVRHGQSDLDAAVDGLTRALNIYVALDDRLGQANALTNLGRARHERGEHETAADNLARALDLYTALGDSVGIAETLNNLGRLAMEHPAAGSPRDYFAQAVTIAREIGCAVHEAHGLVGTARCILRTGDIAAAIPPLRAAHVLLRALGTPEAARVEDELSTLEKACPARSDRPVET